MPKNIIQTERDRYAYIPPAARNVMDENMKSFMPAHLQTYISNNRSGYIPEGMKSTIKKELDRNLPAHLRGYSDAYIEQSMVTPNSSRQSMSSDRLSSPPPIPDRLRRDHSVPVAQQTVELSSLPLASRSMFAADSSTRASNAPAPTADSGGSTPPPPTPNVPNFDFILNPAPPTNATNKIPGVSGLTPTLRKVIAAVGVFTVLVILLVIVASVLKGSSSSLPIENVAADQQELIHVITEASQQQNLDSTDQTFVATASLVLTSNQNQLENYLTVNNQKVPKKVMASRISASVDQNLTLAQTNGDYDQVLDQVLTGQLQSYMRDIVSAYNSSKGPKGRALLKSDYSQANLLLTQLTSPNS